MRFLAAGLAIVVAGMPVTAAAQSYPEKSIRFIAPYAPGGSTDLLTRALAQKLTESLGQTVVPDNRPGAGGNVGAEIAAKSAPDGYTILLAPVSPMAINVSLYGKKLPFNPEKDFAPITLVAKVPLVIVVNLNVPAKTMQEFIALAKSRPGKMTYGSSGNGSSNHMTGAMLMSAAHLDMVHVPYKGGGPGMVALLGGEIDMMVAQIPSSRQLHMAGKVRALAISGAKRSASMPDIPTMIEAGLPGFEATSWYCVVAPAGTPKAIIDRLNTEIVKALNTPEMRQRLADEGAEVEPSTPAGLARFVHAEIPKWAKAVRDSGARID
jgi:tripartite-type tricarboxylate transporter receptor subunit TctC